jgi:hypothetical protein
MSLRHDGLRRVMPPDPRTHCTPVEQNCPYIERRLYMLSQPIDRAGRLSKRTDNTTWACLTCAQIIRLLVSRKNSYRTRAKVHRPPYIQPRQPRKLADDVVLLFCFAFPLKSFRSGRCARHIRPPTSPTSIGAPSLSIHIHSMETVKLCMTS